MLRVVIINLLMFLLPFLVYAGYIYLVRGVPEDRGEETIWSEAPIVWLTGAGVVLALGALIMLGSFKGAQPGAEYRPSVFKDGKIIEGGFEKKPDSPN